MTGFPTGADRKITGFGANRGVGLWRGAGFGGAGGLVTAELRAGPLVGASTPAWREIGGVWEVRSRGAGGAKISRDLGKIGSGEGRSAWAGYEMDG